MPRGTSPSRPSAPAAGEVVERAEALAQRGPGARLSSVRARAPLARGARHPRCRRRRRPPRRPRGRGGRPDRAPDATRSVKASAARVEAGASRRRTRTSVPPPPRRPSTAARRGLVAGRRPRSQCRATRVLAGATPGTTTRSASLLEAEGGRPVQPGPPRPAAAPPTRPHRRRGGGTRSGARRCTSSTCCSTAGRRAASSTCAPAAPPERARHPPPAPTRRGPTPTWLGAARRVSLGQLGDAPASSSCSVTGRAPDAPPGAPGARRRAGCRRERSSTDSTTPGPRAAPGELGDQASGVARCEAGQRPSAARHLEATHLGEPTRDRRDPVTTASPR